MLTIIIATLIGLDFLDPKINRTSVRDKLLRDRLGFILIQYPRPLLDGENDPAQLIEPRQVILEDLEILFPLVNNGQRQIRIFCRHLDITGINR